MGGHGVRSTGKANDLPEDFEEIEDADDFEAFEKPAAVKKPAEDVRLSDNDRKVVNEAVKDAETKLEKTKSEVKNYKETRKVQRAYKLPSIEFLNKPSFNSELDSETEMRTTAKKLVDILKSFGVETKLIGASRGPSVTRYELSPAPGVKISRITSLADDIALGLASTDVRIEAPIPNKAAVGIEVPNKKSSMVTLREVISSKEYKESQGKLLTVALGKDIAGNIRCTDLAKMPHLLIAGTTGSGKSVCLNCMIASVLYNATPEQVKLLMIDPKQVEFSVYNGIPHLLVPVITDARKAAGSLAWAVGEMDSRYKTFSTCGVRDIKSYNNYIKEHPELPFMPQVVIFIDELNDLMMVSPKEVEDSICRLAQKARAAGMHLVVATQRPSVDVITGIIKANIPSRLSLAVSSQVDSRTILDSVGAEKLLGNGDMLFNPVGVSKPVRIQGAYLSDGEIEKIVGFIKNQGTVSYDDEIMQEIEKNATADKKKGGSAANSGDGEDSQLDALIEEAMSVVTELNSASTTVLQRKLSVGYARAARIMDQLEQLGYVSPAEGNKPRKVLITRAQFLEMKARGEAAEDDYDVLSD
ncbi:MAG: DNA translocase FtsK [Ruminococcaceae bacterium]|nr:DNA translocase FtsK [Oscillospiraceae bacterium]